MQKMEQAHSFVLETASVATACTVAKVSNVGLWCQFSTSITPEVEQYHIHTPRNMWAVVSQARTHGTALLECGPLPIGLQKNVPSSTLPLVQRVENIH
jgi:hypothetical protein